jgi:Magnesium chelatase, subunit ChlI
VGKGLRIDLRSSQYQEGQFGLGPAAAHGALLASQPFRPPHPTTSDAGLVGSSILAPGELSLAQHGVHCRSNHFVELSPLHVPDNDGFRTPCG